MDILSPFPLRRYAQQEIKTVGIPLVPAVGAGSPKNQSPLPVTCKIFID